MSLIDLSILPPNLYAANVAELGTYGFHLSMPGRPEPATVNTASLARVAWLMAHGVSDKGNAVPDGLIGSWEWDGTAEFDRSLDPLPRWVYLSADLLGHVEVYSHFKVAYRLCRWEPCGKPFTQRRGRSEVSRWKEYCSDDCRRAVDAQRKRDARAREYKLTA
jgi:hypothetical protein